MRSSETAAAASPQVQQWMDELATSGKVTVGTSRRRYFVHFGLIIAIAITVFVYAYIAGSIELPAMIFSIFLVSGLVLGCAAIVARRYRGKHIVIDRAGLTTMNGQFIAWDDIDGADVYQTARTGPIVRLQVSEPAWEAIISRGSIGMRMMNTFNKAVSGKNAIYFPTRIAPAERDVVDLINSYARGGATP